MATMVDKAHHGLSTVVRCEYHNHRRPPQQVTYTEEEEKKETERFEVGKKGKGATGTQRRNRKEA